MKNPVNPVLPDPVMSMDILPSLTGADGTGFIFPSNRNPSRPISENTLNLAVRACGFSQDQHCSHGFRGSASTMLNEQGWNKEIRVAYSKEAYRVIYVATLGDCVYVLRAFHKKSKVGIATPKEELDLASKRYKEIVKSLRRS